MNQKIDINSPSQIMYRQVEKTKYNATKVNGVHSLTNAPTDATASCDLLTWGVSCWETFSDMYVGADFMVP